MKLKLTPVKGCLDFLPKEALTRKLIIDNVLESYQNNGFLLVKTPILENLEWLTNGDDSENQTKYMFQTIKRGDDLDLTKPNLTKADIVEEGLRYDLTVPLARFFAANRADLPTPFKAIQADEAFRAEKPQKGRYRQFGQCDIDIWGDPTNIAEIEVITTIMESYKNLGLANLVCKINSRKILNSLVLSNGFTEQQLQTVLTIIDKLDKIGTDGCLKEFSERGLNGKDLINKIAAIQKNGIKEITEPADEIKNINEIISVVPNCIFDISLVRGQSYYTGTVFEFWTTNDGYTRALGGGGRYDKMLERFLGESIPAVGGSIGVDSVLASAEALKLDYGKSKIALLYNPEDKVSEILKAKNLLKQKYNVSAFPFPKNFKEFSRKVTLAGFTGFVKMSNINEIKNF